MVSDIFLNLILLIFLLLSIIENNITPSAEQIKHIRKKIPPLPILTFFIYGFLLSAFLILKEQNLTRAYLFFSFSILIIGHAVWLSLLRKRIILVFFVLLSTCIIMYRLFLPSALSHDIFLFNSLVWIGSFLTSLNILTTQRFIIISIIWFIYDSLYVWFTPLAHIVNTKSSTLGFPLSININTTSIGTADVLWATLFLSLLRSVKQKIFGITLLILSNLLLSLYSYWSNTILFFPLLVLWVPLGMIFLIYLTFTNRRSRKD